MEKTQRFIKIEEVISRTGLSRTAIYKRINNRTFPKQIRLGEQRVVWLESEIVEWMNEQINQRNQQEQTK